jgi:hypothetical protein
VDPKKKVQEVHTSESESSKGTGTSIESHLQEGVDNEVDKISVVDSS